MGLCLMFQDLRIEVIFYGDRISHLLSCQVPDNTVIQGTQLAFLEPEATRGTSVHKHCKQH